MAYDGMYGDLSTRGTTNEILSQAIEIRDQVLNAEADVQTLSAQTLVNATLASGSATTATTAAGSASASATNAQTAQNAAETARIAAQQAAADAITNSAAALVVANSANTKSDAAVATANGIDAKATTALNNSVSAVSTANTANTNATNALTTANGVDAKATTALSNSVTAVNTANTANTNASNAVTTANAANTRTTTNIAEGTNLYYTDARVRVATLAGLSLQNVAIAAGDNVLGGFGKTQGQVNALVAADAAEVVNRNAAIASAVSAGVASAVGNRGGVGRNLLDNAGFWVQQRGLTSVSAAANGTYWLDRWQTVGASTTSSVGRFPDATNPGGGSFNMTTTAGGSVQQLIEDINLETGSYTVSWAGTATVSIIGATSSTVFVSNATSPATFTYFPVNHGHMIVRFGAGSVTRPQVERGSVATGFEPRPYSVDLLACQRYYWRAMPAGFNCAAVANANHSFRTWFPVPMRVAPPNIPFNITGYTPSNLTSLGFDAPTRYHFRTIGLMTTAGQASADFLITHYLEAIADL